MDIQDKKKLITKWLTKTIIGLNLCPFAKAPHDNGQIKISISEATSSDMTGAYDHFLNELEFLNTTSPDIITTLLAFPNFKTSFEEFNDFVGSLEEGLDATPLAGVFQLIVFHPEFYFEELAAKQDDLANYVNRSPYPIIHIVYAAELAKAAKTVQAGENISFTNEATIKDLSSAQLKDYFWYI